MSLIIVESPTKARTFNRILKEKGDYFVFATMGHIRDLPAQKMAVDFEHKFKPEYEIIKNKQKIVTQLKKLAKENKNVIFATDPDREGESISYHAAYLLGFIKEHWPDIGYKDKPVKRIVFHEITKHALEEALNNPQELRLDLVKAQQARRLLDRIVGYELSPLLWKTMGKHWLSAGRVQTVALRLIVEREKEIRAFKQEEYYQIYGLFETPSKTAIRAKLISKNDIPYEQKQTLKLFANEYTFTNTSIKKDNKDVLEQDLRSDSYLISSIKEDVQLRYPPPPFTTSLLQQEAFQRFGFTSKMTMRLAQDLYERGMITYHRTDSFNLSTQFVFKAKDFIEKTYGKEYALEKPRGFKTRSKMAQEAHEAIRPTYLDRPFEKSSKKESGLTQNHHRLYKLIFDRALSTQMKEASIKNIDIHIDSAKGYLFEAELQRVMFDGFLKVLNPDYVAKHQVDLTIKEKELMNLNNLEVQEAMTQPPPRYHEGSLIKILEEKGIGRPSTYAPIISLIQDKNYVEKQSRVFTPTKLGEAISDYLSASFPTLFTLDFTAKMEDDLDAVAGGSEDFIKLLSQFNQPFQKELSVKKKDKQVIDVEETIEEPCPQCGGKLTVRFSKFGKFYACSNYPKCKFTKPFLYYVKNAFCPEDNGRLVTRFTKTRKKFYGCENYPTCKYSTWTLFKVLKKPGAPENQSDKTVQPTTNE